MKLIFFCFTAACAIFISACAMSQNKFVTVETIERVKNFTVPIVCGAKVADGSFKITKIIGSSFFINKQGYFLTAGHVLDNWDKINKSKGACFPAVYFPIKGGWEILSKVRWFRFGNCVRPSDADIAVCKTTANPFTIEDVNKELDIATFETCSAVKDGMPVAFTGFPLQSLRPITSIGNIASYVKINKLIIIDKNAWPGASGSPVYLSNGRVIGVLTKRGINDGSGLAYAIASDFILKLFAKNKITFQQGQQP